ncbi:type IV pilus biogenesis/stability protein PilW [Variovorax sp. WS11]|uniref:type IV pilus biogenesis/stability protein PilW n=1 Tax=Variovorax sp. WS11 TaxID=1105204 RepID=UPI000D0DF1E4|nr:type IV pilus biogenesis/stability protein PilW [Variovorax sp. WS11]NDZ11812.1 type IV pilus biogenesis/stability protein PilW [Variovorax sp. WS11]PSL82298.1 type IV pilus biogenesis/stability protein PilW [Variovorax sp. WS11]
MIKAPSTAQQRMMQALFGVAAAVLLAACATKDAGVASTAGNAAGIMTDSDEGNARKRARLRIELAVGYFEQGQPTVALDEIKQALAADPTFADAYNLRGLVYMRLDDAGLAEDSFRRAIALNPRDANALHNYGWLLCQQNRFGDAQQQFSAALAIPSYGDRAKTLMTQGVCQVRAGQRTEAERSLTQAYELDAGNPVIGYNLASLLAQREDWSRAQFYIRRINNGPSASAETLWLGIKVERRLNNRDAVTQLAGQLQRRFPQSREAGAYERGNFND